MDRQRFDSDLDPSPTFYFNAGRDADLSLKLGQENIYTIGMEQDFRRFFERFLKSMYKINIDFGNFQALICKIYEFKV